MDFAAIRRILAMSTSDDWQRVPFGNEQSGGLEARAVLNDDVELSLAWGFTLNRDFKEEWANSFPDSSAASHLVDVTYGGTLVDRMIYVSVDGGRVMIPLPEPYTREDGTHGARVEKWRLNLVRTLHGLGGTVGWDFDDYFNRTGIEVVDEPDEHVH